MKKALNLLGAMMMVAMLSELQKQINYLFVATLTGSQEVPPNASPGIGSGLVTLDTATNMLTVNVSFAGLLSPTTVSHIHCCTLPGANAIVATAVPDIPGLPARGYDGYLSANV